MESRSALESVVPHDAPVAQLDRACASEAQGRVFESFRARYNLGFTFAGLFSERFPARNTLGLAPAAVALDENRRDQIKVAV